MKERVQIKHDLEENWKKAINFTPLPGEIIIYDGIIEDGKYLIQPRLKIGDGVNKVNDLPFIGFQSNTPKNSVEDGILTIRDN